MLRKAIVIIIFLFAPIYGARLHHNAECGNLPVVSFWGWEGDLSELVNGYCDHDHYYVPSLITDNYWRFHTSPQHFTTRALWQDIGVMEMTIAEKQIPMDGYLGGVSLLSYADVGATVWLRRPGHSEWEGPYKVVDCAKVEHMYSHAVYSDSALEVDYNTATRWGLIEQAKNGGGWGLYEVEVFIGNDYPTAVGQPVDYEAWFLQTVEFYR